MFDGKYPIKTYERYARNQPDIRNPRGWAAAARRRGEWDEQVERWCADHVVDPFTGEPVESAGDQLVSSAGRLAQIGEPVINISDCPDCHGVGMWYPEGFEKGVAKCRHPRLIKAA